MKLQYIKNVATLKLDSDKCTGCRICTQVCPHGVLEIKDKKVRIMDLDKCMECGACMNNCAFDALKVAPGVGCALAIINGMIFGGEPNCDCE
jgi:NAD-dependent dihydropyrimidine dehydrogenase PreA subunit